MTKNKKLKTWLWKWHFIAGIISLPFVLILSITGIIYLFKADYEAPAQRHIKEVSVTGLPVSFQKQWDIANKEAYKKPESMILPQSDFQATEFISGMFTNKRSLFINPYTGNVSGEIIACQTDMFKIKKLHGELLMGTFGTKIIELIASWMFVLILTGIYIWWPSRGWKLQGLLIPRLKNGKQIFFRDLHAISGFWISGLLILILAGGFPWTDIFGANFKYLQKVTDTGYPISWNGKNIYSTPKGTPLLLDQMVQKAKALDLPGQVTITLPKGSKGIYSVANFNPSQLDLQQKFHFDQYSGNQLAHITWDKVGFLMRGRMWVMAFHQGEFGFWNWLLVLVTAVILALMSSAALVSYLLRKPKNQWGIPKTPSNFKVGYGILFMLVILSIVFPLFGISLLLITGIEYYRSKTKTQNNIS